MSAVYLANGWRFFHFFVPVIRSDVPIIPKGVTSDSIRERGHLHSGVALTLVAALQLMAHHPLQIVECYAWL